MQQLICARCKEPFAITVELYAVLLRQAERGTLHCPHGHTMHFPSGETEADKFRRERDLARQQIAQRDDEIRRARETAEAERKIAEAERRRANGYKGHAAKLAKRAQAGVCPCCNRHFTALERHMASKHPNFSAEPSAALQ